MMTVRRKLTVGFGAILLILVFLTLAGLREVGTIKQALEENSAKNSLIQRYAINFRGSAHDRAIAIRDVAASVSAEELRREIAEIERLTAFYAKSAVPLDQMLAQDRSVHPEVPKLLAAIKETEARVLPLINQVIQLRSQDQREAAQQIVWRDLKPLFVEWLARINALIDFEEEVIQQRLAEAQGTAIGFSTLMIAWTVVAVLLGAVGATLISRSVSRALGAEPWQVKAVADDIRSGNLASDVDTRGAGQDSVMAAMKMMRDGLLSVVSGVRASAQQVAVSAVEIERGNQDLSRRTESQASALEQTAASMEELGSTVRQNADSAQQANQLAQNASTVAMQGGEVMAEVVATMKDINESARKIADIIGVIDGIAFQTNILALNAAVEAARAGEQGRGFAVVAAEVRSLAGRSAEAARQIKTLISASVERVEQGGALVDRAGATMDEVVASIRKVTELMGEISTASAEQSAGVLEVGEAISGMDQTTQQNAALVEQMTSAAADLKNQAHELVRAVAVFKLDGAESGAATPVPGRAGQPGVLSLA
ncbi:chemotaxis protein [Hylemonella gracilis str. Niagara R]|uniref:Chemotaxis protein n=2 Tax=Hylemonella gracilis TaxID=80880 RepID=A0A016XG10_9BURK|nr:chemotaxis protein [Hylemonella gracilis str. Niagara R]